MNKKYNKYLLLIIIIILSYLAIAYLYKYNKNGFSNLGPYPQSVDLPILMGDYPYTDRKTVSNDSYNDIWWYRPIFRLGSFKQLTNNLRYYRNPDDGTCITAEFCGALYKDKNTKTNIIMPMPPVPNGQGPRVNYYRTKTDLLL